jgi:hypothetical protein
MAGTKLALLSQRLHKQGDLARLLDCSPEQLAVFRFMQKSIDNPTRLKSLSDVIKYIRKYRWECAHCL